MSTVFPLSSPPPASPLTIVPRSRAAAIPAALTPILGREHEIEQVLRLLDRDDLRVVTLLGPGGVGKTRLAQEVARIVEHDFAHGACFVSLAAIRDPELVPTAVAQELGLQESGAISVVDLLIDVLSSQHLLLVLDNMEQVVAASSWLTDLIAKCPLLKVLVTSRIVLNVTTEQRFIVPPLPVPPLDATDIGELAAIELFGQRARAIDVGFAIDERNHSTVAEICRRLDGLPLAIELAAARINVLSPEGILARLSSRLSLLGGGRRNLDVRMRSMRAAIGWSHDLLSENEQDLFGRLSVFVGGFSLEAAAFVARFPDPPMDESEALDAIESLVNQSLVYMVDSAARPRFAMLETIREYGLAELERSKRDESAFLAHAEYYLALGSMANADQIGPEGAHWLDHMESELPNLRVASAWLTDHGRISDAIELNVQVLYCPFARGHMREARAQFETWLAHPTLEMGSRAHALALLMAGCYGLPLGDYARSHPMIDESIEILRELDDKQGLILAMAGFCIGPPMSTLEEIETSIGRISEGIDLARTLARGRFLGLMLGNLSLVYEFRGDGETASHLRDEVELVGREIGDRWLIALVQSARCSDMLRAGDYEQAGRLAAESLHFYREFGDLIHAPIPELYLGIVARATGDLVSSATYLHSALQGARATGGRAQEVFVTIELAALACAQGELAAASKWMDQVLDSFSVLDAPDTVAASLDLMAGLALSTGHHEQAARFLGAADELLERLGTVRLWRHQVNDYRETVSSLQKALGETEFNRLHGEGGALSIDEALTESRAFVQTVLSTVVDKVVAEPEPGHSLSPREVEVLALMADGLSNAEIADKLFLSLRTVTSHITHVLGKLNLSSRTAAVAFAIRQGIV